MKLNEILALRGLPLSEILITRNTINKDSRDYIKELIALGHFDFYQSVQKRDIFKKCKYVVSFTDMPGTKALLYGVFYIKGVKEIEMLPQELIAIKEPENWGAGPYFKYDMQRVNMLKDMEERMVIDWGKLAIKWYQKDLEKEIIEILPQGFFKPFPGYQDVLLSFDELTKIIQNPDANRQWQLMLSNVCGVYLILDKNNDGQQYVGSAYGKDGIWGRWSSYVATKHGNNIKLKELLSQYPEEYKNFQFSILHVLPNSALKEEVTQLETTVKEKLGSRAFGLNAN